MANALQPNKQSYENHIHHSNRSKTKQSRKIVNWNVFNYNLHWSLFATCPYISYCEWSGIRCYGHTAFCCTVGYVTIEVQENHRKMDTIEATNCCMLIKFATCPYISYCEWSGIRCYDHTAFCCTVGFVTIEVQENHRKMDTIEATNCCMLIKISEEHRNRVRRS